MVLTMHYQQNAANACFMQSQSHNHVDVILITRDFLANSSPIVFAENFHLIYVHACPISTSAESPGILAHSGSGHINS